MSFLGRIFGKKKKKVEVTDDLASPKGLRSCFLFDKSSGCCCGKSYDDDSYNRLNQNADLNALLVAATLVDFSSSYDSGSSDCSGSDSCDCSSGCGCD